MTLGESSVHGGILLAALAEPDSLSMLLFCSMQITRPGLLFDCAQDFEVVVVQQDQLETVVASMDEAIRHLTSLRPKISSLLITVWSFMILMTDHMLTARWSSCGTHHDIMMIAVGLTSGLMRRAT